MGRAGPTTSTRTAAESSATICSRLTGGPAHPPAGSNRSQVGRLKQSVQPIGFLSSSRSYRTKVVGRLGREEAVAVPAEILAGRRWPRCRSNREGSRAPTLDRAREEGKGGSIPLGRDQLDPLARTRTTNSSLVLGGARVNWPGRSSPWPPRRTSGSGPHDAGPWIRAKLFGSTAATETCQSARLVEPSPQRREQCRNPPAARTGRFDRPTRWPARPHPPRVPSYKPDRCARIDPRSHPILQAEEDHPDFRPHGEHRQRGGPDSGG